MNGIVIQNNGLKCAVYKWFFGILIVASKQNG